MPSKDVRDRRDGPKTPLEYAIWLAEKHELELHGERGLFKALTDISEQLKWTNRAMWGMVATVMVGVILAAAGFK